MANIPIFTKILGITWAMKSPLQAEVYFVNIKMFTKWQSEDDRLEEINFAFVYGKKVGNNFFLSGR